jgi:DNA-binding response OmpR family regulator
MLTGTPTYGETEFNASQLGIDAFLLKPVNLHELIALIENKLNAKRSKRVQSHYLLGLLFT